MPRVTSSTSASTVREYEYTAARGAEMPGGGSPPLLSSLARSWLAEARGRVLVAGWAATLAGVTLTALVHRRRAKIKLKERREKEDAKAAKPTDPSSPIRSLLKIAIPSYLSEPVLWGAALSVGIGCRLVVQMRVSSEIGAMGSLLAQRKWQLLFKRQLLYALYGLPAAGLAAFQKFASTNLAFACRRTLAMKVRGGCASSPRLSSLLSALLLSSAVAAAEG